MNLDILNSIRHYIMIAESGSFKDAAHKLNISPSVLTRSIQALEAYLNTQLIIRTTRSLKLTTAGLTYLESVRQIITTLDKANSAIKKLHQIKPHGTINLSMPGIMQGEPHIRFFAKFSRAYPDIILNINNNMSPFQLINNQADIVISEFNINDKQFNREILYSINKRVFAAPKYLEQYGKPSTINDLQEHNCLLYAPASPTGIWEFAKRTKVKIKSNYRVESGVSIIPAAVAGIGLIWVEEDLVKAEVAEGKLVPIDIKPEMYSCMLNLYYLPTAYTGIVRLLIDEIIEYFNSYQNTTEKN